MYFEEISQLIDSYREGDLTTGDDLAYSKFKSFIGWQAKNHIFDTHGLMDLYSEYDEEGNAYVSIKEDDNRRKGNVEKDWSVAAGLQVYIAASFENNRYPGISRGNERLYLTLREVAQEIYNNYEVVVRDNSYLDILSDAQKIRLGIDTLGSKYRKDLEGAIEDFLVRMERSDFVHLSEDSDVNESDKPVVLHRYEVVNDQFPDEREIRERNRVLSFEKEFLLKYDALLEQEESLVEYGWNSINEHKKERIRLSKFASRIRKENRNRDSKSIISSFTEHIENIAVALKKDVFNEMIDSLIDDLKLQGSPVDMSTRTGQPMSVVDSRIGKFYTALQEKLPREERRILGVDDRFVVAVFNTRRLLDKSYLSISRYNRQNAKAKVINLYFDDDVEKEPGEMKLTEIKGKEDFSDVNEVYRDLKMQVKRYLKI